VNPAHTARIVTLLVDAAATPLRPATPLFPDDGEYARTIAALAMPAAAAGDASGAHLLPLVPDRLLLSIYTSELAERLREAVRRPPAETDGDLTLHAPFWPDLLFHAADELVHPAREVARLWPKLDAICFVARDVATLRAAARRILGGERFDLERYRGGAAEFAQARHFERIDP
jgi:hypothetical protein